jgi:hypothetical protein
MNIENLEIIESVSSLDKIMEDIEEFPSNN